MSLPTSVRVKLSSEAAGAITITPVVVREIPIRELVEQVLISTGKSEERIADLLNRGNLVSGASRFRWEPFQADVLAIKTILESFPDPDPSRAFRADACARVLLRGPHMVMEIQKESAAKRKLFRSTSFWDALMEAIQAGAPAYVEYSYKERADRYKVRLDLERVAQVRAAASRLVYSTLVKQIQVAAFDTLEPLVSR
jgi:hypothetical protein